MVLEREGRSFKSRWLFIDLDRLTENEDRLIEFLSRHHVVNINQKCPQCKKPNMRIFKRKTNGVVFRCGKRHPGGNKCNGETGFLKGSYLESSKMPVIVSLKFIFLWSGFHYLNRLLFPVKCCQGYRLTNRELKKISEQCQMNLLTAVRLSKFCGKVVYWSMIRNSELIGGNGDVVEIDESKFGKKKVSPRSPCSRQLGVRGISRNTGKAFMVQVERRDRETLFPLVKRWILPGSLIIADGWKAYDRLSQEDYQLLRVNHSKEFKARVEDIPDSYSEHIDSDPFLEMLRLCHLAHDSGEDLEYDDESDDDSSQKSETSTEQLMDKEESPLSLVSNKHRRIIQSESDGEGVNLLEDHISDVGDEDRYICDKLMIDLTKNDYPCSVNDKLSTKWRGKWYKAACIECSVNPKGEKYIKVLFDEGGLYDYPERNWNASVRPVPMSLRN